MKSHTNPFILDPTYGSSIDWILDQTSAKLAFAVEMRDTGEHGFLLPAKLIEPACSEIWMGIQATIREALKMHLV